MITLRTKRSMSPRFGLSYDAFARLVLIDAEGVRHVGVEPVRTFPISEPGRGISICDCEGRELMCLESLDELPAATRTLLLEDLSRREFMPIIERIDHVSALADPSQWDVRTDRGTTSFLLNSEDDVRRLGRDRAIIIDVQGIRYLIPDIRQLDAHSRRILERYI